MYINMINGEGAPSAAHISENSGNCYPNITSGCQPGTAQSAIYIA